MNWWPPKARREPAPPPRPVSYAVVPAEPIYDAEIVDDAVVALRPQYLPRSPETVDYNGMGTVFPYLRCKDCGMQVTNVTKFELEWSKPCPLCIKCPVCRDLCKSDQVTHGFEE